MTYLPYRAEIDGLRALAVAAVVVYHAGFILYGHPVLGGGFLGVDIFFVLSGYLITGILLKQLATGTFSFRAFYARRVRRILPALLTVLLVTLPVGWIVMLPKAFKEYAATAMATVLFSSNLWFLQLDSYWAEPAQMMPLLHTWSLAVEEQYYLLYPVLLWGSWKWARPWWPWGMGVGLILSLMFAHTMANGHQETAYYLLTGRCWELFAGGLVASWHARPNLPPKNTLPIPVATLFNGLGLACIAASLALCTISGHPSLLTAWPVAGTAVILGFGRKGEWITRCLSCRPLVWLGLRSYSVYLWHYPVFAFARLGAGPMGPMEKLGAILLTLLLAELSYRFVEQPFRSRPGITTGTLTATVAVAMATLLVANGYIYISEGAPYRFKKLFWLLRRAPDFHASVSHNFVDITEFNPNKITVVVIGDSYARNIAHSIADNTEFEVNYEHTYPSCKMFTLPNLRRIETVSKCPSNKKLFTRSFETTQIVILSSFNSFHHIDQTLFMDTLQQHIDTMRQHGFKGPVVIIGRRPEFKENPLQLVLKSDSLAQVNQLATKHLRIPLNELYKHETLIATYYNTRAIHYYPLIDKFCTQTTCRLIHNNQLLYLDISHFSEQGERYLSAGLTTYLKHLVSSQAHDKTSR
ncbi:MAG: acyltransferase [Cyanobacteria bacterium HKST-UBA04]|nr:acyltransferase [Cyanobacteria bacterium HKST-UBA04]